MPCVSVPAHASLLWRYTAKCYVNEIVPPHVCGGIRVLGIRAQKATDSTGGGEEDKEGGVGSEVAKIAAPRAGGLLTTTTQK